MHIEKFRFAKSICPVFLASPLVDWPLFPVRAYVLSSGLNPENLVRAETALNELLDSIPPDDVSTHSPRYCLSQRCSSKRTSRIKNCIGGN